MQTVFDAGDLTAPQKAVLLAYCNFTDPHGYCWPGVERIADMTGLSVSGVKKIRKQLIEDKLLTTVSRGKKGGGRKTNGSRINVKRLQKMKLPPREYDDNLMPELGFEEDDEPEASEAKVPEGHINGSPGAPQKYLGGTNVGTSGGPYPSVDPSVEPSGDPSSSSAEVEDITHEAAAPVVEKKTKKSPEQIIIERLSCTEDEAAKVAVYINQQGDGRGGRIRSLSWWVGDRDIHTLRQDLAVVRGSQKPAGASYDKDPGASLRSINGSGYKPYKNPENQDAYDEPLLAPPAKAHTGARAPVPDHTFFDTFTDADLKASF